MHWAMSLDTLPKCIGRWASSMIMTIMLMMTTIWTTALSLSVKRTHAFSLVRYQFSPFPPVHSPCEDAISVFMLFVSEFGAHFSLLVLNGIDHKIQEKKLFSLLLFHWKRAHRVDPQILFPSMIFGRGIVCDFEPPNVSMCAGVSTRAHAYT